MNLGARMRNKKMMSEFGGGVTIAFLTPAQKCVDLDIKCQIGYIYAQYVEVRNGKQARYPFANLTSRLVGLSTPQSINALKIIGLLTN